MYIEQRAQLIKWQKGTVAAFIGIAALFTIIALIQKDSFATACANYGVYFGIAALIDLAIFGVATFKRYNLVDYNSITLRKVEDSAIDALVFDRRKPEKTSKTARNMIIRGMPEGGGEVWILSPSQLEPIKKIRKNFPYVKVIGNTTHHQGTPLNFTQDLFDRLKGGFIRAKEDPALLAFIEWELNRPINFKLEEIQGQPRYIVCSMITSELAKNVLEYCKIAHRRIGKTEEFTYEKEQVFVERMETGWIEHLYGHLPEGGRLYLSDRHFTSKAEETIKSRFTIIEKKKHGGVTSYILEAK